MKAGEKMSNGEKRRKHGKDRNYKILKRILVLLVMFGVVVFLPIGWKLWDLQVIQHDTLEQEAIEQQTSELSINAQRGTIYDSQGNVLAISSTVYDVILSPKAIAEKQEELDEALASAKKAGKSTKEYDVNVQELIAKNLANLLDGVTEEDVAKKCTDKKSQYKKIATKIDTETEAAVRKFISKHELARCVYLTPNTKRYYPYSNLAAQVIGFTNDNGGAYGVEAQYNTELAGTNGLVVTATNARGTDLMNFFQDYYDAKNGDSVKLTLDATIQSYCEKYLKEGIQSYDVRKGGFIIVMDCKTGGILGMASSPDYDLNDYSTIIDKTLLNKVKGGELKESEALNEMWRNKALNDTYEPGSTFKSVVLASALEAGTISTKDTFYCSGSVKMGKWTIKCSNRAGHGQQTLAEAVGHSCNPAFIKIGQSLGTEKFYSYLNAFGFTDSTGIDLPGEGNSVIWDEGNFNTVNLATASFGQRFTVTPVQLITAVNAVVNGGYLYTPHVVQSITNKEGNTVYEADNTPVRQVISEKTSATCAEILEGVVSKYGGSNAYQAGYRIGGKTGTSETLVKDEYITSFIGFAPANDPQVIALVGFQAPKVKNKGSDYTTTGYYISGGSLAAPIAGELIADVLDYLGFEKEYTANDLTGASVSVPSLTGYSSKQAQEALNNKDLTYRTVGGGDTVTAQIPAAGTTIPSGSKVILYLGETPPKDSITMPDLTGMTPDQAKAALNNLNLYMMATGTSGNYTSSTVAYKQSVKRGKKVARGTVVTVSFTNKTEADNDRGALQR